MYLRSIVLIFMIFWITGCSKNNNPSRPTITLKSYTDLVTPNTVFNALLTYSQPGGSLSLDTLVILYRRYNVSQIPPDNQRSDSFLTIMPQTPNTNAADFSASLSWANISYGINNENDTVDFRFVLVDLKGIHSDTVTTGRVIITQQ